MLVVNSTAASTSTAPVARRIAGACARSPAMLDVARWPSIATPSSGSAAPMA